VNDGVLPARSYDPGTPRVTWWPHRGTGEWVQYDFARPRSLSSSAVYWFDDTDHGHCRVPKSWKILYLDGDTWKEVSQPSGYGTAVDQLNKVTFKPVITQSVRLWVDLQSDYSGGILEWQVGN
jgi:hypothetical protein